MSHYHSKAVGLWLVAALTPALLTKNPFYLLIAILAVAATYRSLDRSGPAAWGWGLFLRLGLILVAFSVVFNLLSVRAGATKLFTLPELRFETTLASQPQTVLQLGGPVSLESLVFGLSSGLALLAVLVSFATFNTLVDHYQLLRSAPRFLYQSAIVMSIAITFVPQMLLAQQEIREAQALRGHRFRGIRDLLPLFITLLAEGLERSITLAESMEARGFGGGPSAATAPRSLLLKSLIALALAVLAGGAFARSYFPNKTPGGLAMLAGGGLLVVVLWLIGRGVQRSRYRRELWRRRDTLLAGASLITSLALLVTWATGRAALIFYPYPRLAWPPFNPLLGLVIVLIAAPVVAGRLSREGSYD
ncbi:MAG: energy-coupling factor transporter transmembrane component T [Anaerolineae bacterium]